MLSQDDLVLTAAPVPATQLDNRFGFLFTSAAVEDPVPLGNGLRCVPLPLQRWTAANSGPSGVLTFGPGLAAESTRLPAGFEFLPGSTFTFQAWYRDLGGPCGAAANLSSSISVTLTP